MPRHALSNGAAFGNESSAMIRWANTAQKPVAATVDNTESPLPRRKRGKHRKPARPPFGEPGLRAGATLSVLGAVLIPQFAHSEPAGEVRQDDARALAEHSPVGKQSQQLDRFRPAKDAAATRPAAVSAEQDHRGGKQRTGPKHARRDEPVPTPEQQIEEWAQANAHVGVPARALEAYARAERRMSKEQPRCGISWTLLAGVGRIESNHGQFDGAKLGDKGLPSKQIIGIPLDGSAGVLAITDTDGGKMDNDTTWDRAVGPMQFIPSTWTNWAEDANGDDFKDPHFIDDAALTAANYLCGHSGDLTTESGERAALLSYNNSTSYGDMAIEGSHRYAEETQPLPKPTASAADRVDAETLS